MISSSSFNFYIFIFFLYIKQNKLFLVYKISFLSNACDWVVKKESDFKVFITSLIKIKNNTENVKMVFDWIYGTTEKVFIYLSLRPLSR